MTSTLEKIIKLEDSNKVKIDSQLRKIFVGGLPHDVKLEVFRGYFLNFGSIEDIVILQDKRTHKPRGFGFVTFDSIRSVDQVMQKLDEHYIEDKWVDVKSAFSVE
jgi:RNA-binding protein Musashi